LKIRQGRLSKTNTGVLQLELSGTLSHFDDYELLITAHLFDAGGKLVGAARHTDTMTRGADPLAAVPTTITLNFPRAARVGQVASVTLATRLLRPSDGVPQPFPLTASQSFTLSSPN